MSRILTIVIALALCPLASAWQIATFSAEVTPPLGHAMMGGGIAPAQTIVDPLYIRGVVLLGTEQPIVFAAIDWCEIRNDAYDHWRTALADAAHTVPERVLFAAIHQHDTPIADFEAQRLLDAQGLHNALCDTPYVMECAARAAEALRNALKAPQPVTHYGYGQTDVVEVASSRRYVEPGGAVNYNRTSATGDAAMRAFEEGVIDPVLRTLSFWDGDIPRAAMSFYSVHPMSFYGKGGVSADFVGMARTLRQAADPTVFQVYFSGCSGDTIAGKYNDGNPANRVDLAKKMYDAMDRAWTATQRHPLDQVLLRTTELRLEARSDGGFAAGEMEKTLADPAQKTFIRILAAMGLSWHKRTSAGQPIIVPAVDFGQAIFLLMPAESFVGYQIMAQEIAGKPVCVAGYGESAPGYIPTAIATKEGFNQQHEWCWVSPTAEVPMRAAMEAVLVAK